MVELGIVLVSHSKNLAQGIADLVAEVAKDIPFTYVGGTEDGQIGTSFDQVQVIVGGKSRSGSLSLFRPWFCPSEP